MLKKISSFILEIRKKIRWKIACWLDNYEETCWANLVTWSLDPKNENLSQLWTREWGERSIWQQDCSAKNGGAWCGKCAITRRIPPKKSDYEILDMDKKFKSFPLDMRCESFFIKFKGDDKNI